MRKILIPVFIFVFVQIQNAQESSPKNKDWFHSDFKKTGIYGIGTNEAYQFLNEKKIKPKTVIVGVIDSGTEVDHEDLKDNIWVNKKELNGKEGVDDDQNGYVDDVHGWNFIGSKEGRNVKYDTYEMTRIIKKYQDIFEGEHAERFKIDNPDKAKVYERAKKEYNEKKSKAENALANIKSNKEQTLRVYDVLKDFYGDKEINKVEVEKIDAFTEREKALKEILLQIASDPELKGKNMSDVLKLTEEQFKEGEEYYSNNLEYYLNLEFEPRGIVGDDYGKKDEKNYGNNHYEGPDAEHGTHVAGIIAAKKGNGIGTDGIASDVAKILVVRAVPDGDERDKDIANAIYYAVNNGAKVINMSFGKAFSPEQAIVNLAVKYAEENDVLLVHAAGNDNKDIDVEENYPTNFKRNDIEPYVKNWITVGASTENPENIKASFSNFGSMKVDVFAPGNDIYAPVIENKYKSNSGTSMAAPVVAACATVLRAYFPKLKAHQVKEILLKSSNKSNQEVNLEGEKTRTFDAISTSGGVVDLNQAVRLAFEKYK